MSENIHIEALQGVGQIVAGDNVGEIIINSAQETDFTFNEQDILCVASKAVSSAENNVIRLDEITPSDLAHSLHEQIPRKDVRAIQAIIDATGDPSGSRLEVKDNYIGGWLPNGLFLTSAGVDKLTPEELILLPKDAALSARHIGETILSHTGVNVGVIITDSEGRPDKRGSAQIAIGTYGVPPLRTSEATLEDGKVKRNEETICDMLAASAAMLMGQRGFNRPVVKISGFDYTFDTNAKISDALVESKALRTE